MLGNTILKITNSSSQNITLMDGSKFVLFLWVDPFLGEESIFIQRVASTGRKSGEVINLSIPNCDSTKTYYAQIVPLANSEYIAVLDVIDADSVATLFLQRFNADNTKSGALLEWSTLGHNRYNQRPQIAVLGQGGFVMMFMVEVSLYQFKLFVKQFNADGSPIREPIALNLPGKIIGASAPQITLLREGGYVFTWQGLDLQNNFCMLIQKFNSEGRVMGNIIRFDAPTNPINDEFDLQNLVPKITSNPEGGYLVSFYKLRE